MPYFTGEQRLKITLGGFISFIGFIVLALIILVTTKIIEIENFVQPELLIYFMVVIGVLDIIAGILLLRSR